MLSAKQGQAILEYELTRSSNTFVTGVMVTGGISISLGIIASIASNWNEVPDYIKLIAFFMLWMGVACASFVSSNSSKTSLRELTETVFSLVFFAGVGLIAQIFNVKSGNTFALISLWCLTMAPLALTMRSTFLPALWLLGLLSLPKQYLASTHLPKE